MKCKRCKKQILESETCFILAYAFCTKCKKLGVKYKVFNDPDSDLFKNFLKMKDMITTDGNFILEYDSKKKSDKIRYGFGK